MTQTALVVGASGIVGSAITQLLIDNQWQVAALSRHPSPVQGVIPVAADLQDPASLARALADLKPTHVFITTWSRQATEAENIRVNAAMVSQCPRRHSSSQECQARSTGDGPETLPRPIRSLWQRQPSADTVSRRAGSSGCREFLLRPRRRALRCGCKGRLHLERSSPAYRHRGCRRQCDEHGNHPRRLCLDLQNRPIALSCFQVQKCSGTALPI
jgi:hypothetical protein